MISFAFLFCKTQAILLKNTKELKKTVGSNPQLQTVNKRMKKLSNVLEMMSFTLKAAAERNQVCPF